MDIPTERRSGALMGRFVLGRATQELMMNVKAEARETGRWTETAHFADLAHSFNALFQSSGFRLTPGLGMSNAAVAPTARTAVTDAVCVWTCVCLCVCVSVSVCRRLPALLSSQRVADGGCTRTNLRVVCM
jgi:hypothetical protein